MVARARPLNPPLVAERGRERPADRHRGITAGDRTH